jgi:hypothetical protein
MSMSVSTSLTEAFKFELRELGFLPLMELGINEMGLKFPGADDENEFNQICINYKTCEVYLECYDAQGTSKEIITLERFTTWEKFIMLLKGLGCVGVKS